MEYIFKSNNLKQLDQLKQAILNEIPCYRITEVEVIKYESSTPLDTFIEKIKYIPLPEVAEFINTEIDNNDSSNNDIIDLNKESNSYNQGNFNLNFKITKGTRKDNPCYNSIKLIQWIPEEGVLKVTPNIDYEGNIEFINKVDELSKNYSDVLFPELRLDTTLSYVNRIVDHMKWVPYLDKIYLLEDKVEANEIHVALVCANATEDDWEYAKRLLEEAPILQKMNYEKGAYEDPEEYEDSDEIEDKKVLLYSRDKDIDQNKEYSKYEIFDNNLESTLKGYSDNRITWIRTEILPLIGLLKYLPFVKEVYYARISTPTKLNKSSIVLFCSNTSEENWVLLERLLIVKTITCYRGDELIEGGVIMKQFNNTKILLSRRS